MSEDFNAYDDDRYEVLSTDGDAPDDVIGWCATSVLWKAQAVFNLLAPHGERLGYRHLTLWDRHAGKGLRSVD